MQHFQRDIVRDVEGYIVTGSKQVEIGHFLTSSTLMIVLLGKKNKKTYL